jgi:hypothetical protein
MQEEAEPRAFASSLVTDEIHAVVPVAAAKERKPVSAGCDPAVDGAQAMFEQRPSLPGRGRCAIGLVLVGREQRRRQIWDPFVEYAGVAGHAHVLGGHMGQPEEIVRAAAAQTAAGRLVPPVLHIAFDELPPG